MYICQDIIWSTKFLEPFVPSRLVMDCRDYAGDNNEKLCHKNLPFV